MTPARRRTRSYPLLDPQGLTRATRKIRPPGVGKSQLAAGSIIDVDMGYYMMIHKYHSGCTHL